MCERATEPMTYEEKKEVLLTERRHADRQMRNVIRDNGPLSELAYWYGRMTGLAYGICALSFEKPIDTGA